MVGVKGKAEVTLQKPKTERITARNARGRRGKSNYIRTRGGKNL